MQRPRQPFTDDSTGQKNAPRNNNFVFIFQERTTRKPAAVEGRSLAWSTPRAAAVVSPVRPRAESRTTACHSPLNSFLSADRRTAHQGGIDSPQHQQTKPPTRRLAASQPSRHGRKGNPCNVSLWCAAGRHSRNGRPCRTGPFGSSDIRRGLGSPAESSGARSERLGEDQENNQDASGDRRADDRRRDDPADSEEAWVRLASTAAESPAPTEPTTLSHNRVQSSIDDITLAGSQQQSSQAGLWLKRGIDVVGAGIGLVLAGPAILGAMAAIKLTDGGPVFFRQTREGQNGRPFTILKLRTMIVDAEKFQAELRAESHRDGPAFKISRDPRVTKVGHFLRATCLDELPQLINVLTGDMSLVGPRPLPWHESRACERWHRRRLDVRPGLTCTWQVNKAKAVTFDDWMRMDLRYIDQLGLFQDLRLIAQTVVVPVTGRGGE